MGLTVPSSGKRFRSVFKRFKLQVRNLYLKLCLNLMTNLAKKEEDNDKGA